jgi:hypothetical protein
MNNVVAGIDLGDSVSAVAVLSPNGDVTDRFSFPMDDEGYSASRTVCGASKPPRRFVFPAASLTFDAVAQLRQAHPGC